MSDDETIRIGNLLEKAGLVTSSDLVEAVQVSRRLQTTIGRVLIMSGCITEKVLKAADDLQAKIKDKSLSLEVALPALVAVSEEDLSLEEALSRKQSLPSPTPAVDGIGEILLEFELISSDDLNEALKANAKTGASIASTLVSLGKISPTLSPLLQRLQDKIRKGQLSQAEASKEFKSAYAMWQKTKGGSGNSGSENELQGSSTNIDIVVEITKPVVKLGDSPSLPQIASNQIPLEALNLASKFAQTIAGADGIDCESKAQEDRLVQTDEVSQADLTINQSVSRLAKVRDFDYIAPQARLGAELESSETWELIDPVHSSVPDSLAGHFLQNYDDFTQNMDLQEKVTRNEATPLFEEAHRQAKALIDEIKSATMGFDQTNSSATSTDRIAPVPTIEEQSSERQEFFMNLYKSQEKAEDGESAAMSLVFPSRKIVEAHFDTTDADTSPNNSSEKLDACPIPSSISDTESKTDLVELLKSAGYFTEKSLFNSLKAALTNAERSIQLLKILGVVNDDVLNDGKRCQQLLELGNINLQQAAFALSSCRIGRLNLDEALKEAGFDQTEGKTQKQAIESNKELLKATLP